MASSKADLVRIGREGFELIEQFMDKKGTGRSGAAVRKPHVFPQETRQVCLYQYQPQKSHVYQVKPNEKMNTYEVVQYRDGVSVMDYTKRNSAPMFY
ncbi:hypothetical protein C2S51_026450 [Perilla frutescens var. frutescens]|nr:hypothetical protein C2S51_026450 [Perilla frutescens var. frutescens]